MQQLFVYLEMSASQNFRNMKSVYFFIYIKFILNRVLMENSVQCERPQCEKKGLSCNSRVDVNYKPISISVMTRFVLETFFDTCSYMERSE